MRVATLIALLIIPWALSGCGCGDRWSYDSGNNTLQPIDEETGILVSGLSIMSRPQGPWGYSLAINIGGPHRAETKAFAITRTGSDGNPIDFFVLWGDGRADAYSPFTFHAPIVVKEITAKEQNLRWPDHVFAPGYPLRPLPELEAYLRTHRHLPGLPSAEEVAQKGLPLVQTQAQLLEKVEELTLYIIQLQKEVDSLKALLARRP